MVSNSVAHGQLVADFFQRDLSDFIERDGDDPSVQRHIAAEASVRGRGNSSCSPASALTSSVTDFDHGYGPSAIATGGLLGYDLDEARDIKNRETRPSPRILSPRDSRTFS